ncbi:MAG: multicopper oxidase domain-containing protein [Halieaceae bacterium]
MWLLLAMVMNDAGMVMNANSDILPRGCEAISRDYEFQVEAGMDYAADAPGAIFGMSDHELIVEPCSRLTVTFTNRDEVRHQWMVHGLPRYLYPGGMFHIEANGGATMTGTFIVPGDDKTYLLHCDMAQHMEKGMKGQLVVGRGSGDLWSVKGVSDAFERDSYLPADSYRWLGLWALLGIAAGCGAAWFMASRRRRS